MPSLYSTYRPKNFSEIIGQNHITTLLIAELKRNLTGHAYLFVGPRGTGKTSIARIFAKALNCTNLKDGNPCGECTNCKAIENNQFIDLIEIDAASNRGINEIRELKQKIEYNPAMGKQKVYIIDEVHMLTKEAFNALLKTLEEPPSYATFILATTEPHKIPATIMSRCEKFEFRLGMKENVIDVLDSIATSEDVSVSPEAMDLLFAHSGGSYRDAISLLDTIIAVTGDKHLNAEEIRNALGLPESTVIIAYIDAVIRQSLSDALEVLNEIFSRGTNVSQFTKTLILEIRDLLIGIVSEDTPNSLKEYDKNSYAKMIRVLLDAYTSQRNAFDHRLPLQLATAQLIDDATFTGLPKLSNRQDDEEKGHNKAENNRAKSKIKKETKVDVVSKGNKVIKKTEKISIIKQQKGKALTFTTIEEKWTLFIKEVQGMQNSLYTFIMSSKPSGAQFDVQIGVTKVEIKVPFSFHKKQLENPVNQEILKTAALNIFGEPVQLVCLISKDEIVFKERTGEIATKTVMSPPVQSVSVDVNVDESTIDAAFDAILGTDVEMLP